MSGPGFHQNLSQRQTQQMVLAPQLRQSLKILQVAALDLRSVIQEELQSNPTLEELPMEGETAEKPGEDDATGTDAAEASSSSDGDGDGGAGSGSGDVDAGSASGDDGPSREEMDFTK